MKTPKVRMSFFWKKMPHSVSKVPRLSQLRGVFPKNLLGGRAFLVFFIVFGNDLLFTWTETGKLSLGWRATWKTSEGTTYTMEIASRKKTTLYVGGLDDKVAEELLHVSQCI